MTLKEIKKDLKRLKVQIAKVSKKFNKEMDKGGKNILPHSRRRK